MPPIWLQAARTMGAEGLKLLVVVPAALPALVAGMKQAWSFAWRSLMGGELLFMTVGLGQIMNMGRELNNISQVVASMILIVLLGFATERFVFGLIERKIAERWGYKRV